MAVSDALRGIGHKEAEETAMEALEALDDPSRRPQAARQLGRGVLWFWHVPARRGHQPLDPAAL